MSSKQHMFELNGKKYGFSLPEGQEPTEDLLQKIVEKIEKKEKEKAQKMYSVAPGAGGSPDDEKVEDKNLIDTQAGVEDAMTAKNNALTQGVQENFENVAEEKADEKSISDAPKEAFMASGPTIERAAEELAIDVANSDTAQMIAAQSLGAELSMSVAIEGLQELNAQEDDAYLFVNKDKEDEELLDVNALKKEAPEKEEGILNRNVSEKEKAADGVLDIEVKDLSGVEQEKKTEAHHLSPVQELDKEAHDKKADEKLHNTENSATLPQKDSLQRELGRESSAGGLPQKDADFDVLKDKNAQGSMQLGNSNQLEKSKERLPNVQEKAELERKAKETSSEKEKEKSKSLDKTNGKEKNGKVKQKVDKEKVEQLLKLTGRKLPKGKKNGEKGGDEKVPFRYSQIANKDQSSSKIKEANNQNSAALRKALGVGRGR